MEQFQSRMLNEFKFANVKHKIISTVGSKIGKHAESVNWSMVMGVLVIY